MISRWVWVLRSVLRTLWVRVASFAFLAILTAGLAPVLSPLVPQSWTEALGGNAVDQVLSILASSMLAVTTFSLSIAVNAFTAAEATATPRATALLQEDQTTQTTLATFLGAFVYSIVAIIGLNAGYYGDGGRVVLFMSTIFVVAIVVIALLRWIGYLPEFGRMNNTLDRLETATLDALKTRLAAPWLGGHPYSDALPDGARPVTLDRAGYVQYIDVEALQSCAEDCGVQVWLAVLPGDFIHPATEALHILGPTEDADRFRDVFTLAPGRSFDQDPVYGLIVLAEIASRALSPGVNDPGTAIAVIGRQVSVLSTWTQREGPDVQFDRVHVPAVRPEEALDAAFRPILRDGVDTAEVLLRLIAALDALDRIASDTYGDGVARLLEEVDERVERATGLSTRDRDDIATRRQATVSRSRIPARE